ncbi:cystathionine gamma-lyase [Streptomyces lonarensis]|nr:cystathionine gamma-lyase [Streptomyces lonarensis]
MSTPPNSSPMPDATGDATRAAHAGLPAAEPFRPPMPGPVMSAYFHLPGDPTGAPYAYGRETNPTWTALETAVAELESPGEPAHAAVFASGMAAVAAVLFGHLRPGDTVVVPSDGYHGVHQLGDRLGEFGVTVRQVATADTEGQLAALADARLLWLETPANPGLDTCDIRALADAARERGVLVAVDNTLPTPLGQRPLELGADLSVASGTKGFSGHGDVLLGYVATRDAALLGPVRTWRSCVGAVPGPMETWLAHRGMATLPLRLERQSANALAIARRLLERGDVADVRYPGLPGDPGHAVAAAQMSAFGGVVSFTLPDRAHAERFLAALRVIGEATSFGGVRSMAERRARWTEPPAGPTPGDGAGEVSAADDPAGAHPAAQVPPGFIRLSVGIEDAADLIADVDRALDETARSAD